MLLCNQEVQRGRLVQTQSRTEINASGNKSTQIVISELIYTFYFSRGYVDQSVQKCGMRVTCLVVQAFYTAVFSRWKWGFSSQTLAQQPFQYYANFPSIYVYQPWQQKQLKHCSFCLVLLIRQRQLFICSMILHCAFLQSGMIAIDDKTCGT